MGECNRCQDYGLHFHRKYAPQEFLEGKTNSPVWIISLNPNGDSGFNDSREKSELEDFKAENGKLLTELGFFKNFRNVSERLFNSFGKYNGVAHTDIVKCYANTFPAQEQIPDNCKSH